MRIRLLAIAASALVAGHASTAAQASQAPTQSPVDVTSLARPVPGPAQHYVLDYATGHLSPVDSTTSQEVGNLAVSTSAYDNSCTSGFFVPVCAGDEFLDWGTKSAGLTEVVDQFSFAYATDLADTSAGGPGASMQIAFFSGSNGFGTLGTEVARFAFTGLPASASAGSVSAYVITVDISGGFEFCLPDGDIGYSYCSFDDDGSGSATGPLIGDIASCPLGQDDAFDIYSCPATVATYAGTFFFGGSPTATWFMQIEEDDGSDLATTTVDNGSGINPLLLSDGGTPPVIGQTWPATMDTATGGQLMSAVIGYFGPLAAGTVVLPQGELLVDPSSGFVFSSIVAGTGINDHSEAVPKDVTFIGFDVYVQGLAFGGVPAQLSNSLAIHIGF